MAKKTGAPSFPIEALELVVRDLRAKIVSFEELEAAGFPSSDLPFDLLVPVPQELGNDRPFAACKVQFSAIRGGTVITWAMSHSVGDGIGNNELFRVLSEEARLAQEQQGKGASDEPRSEIVTADMGLDRSVLRSMNSEVPFDIKDHPAYTLESNSSANSQPSDKSPTQLFEATAPEVPVLLPISAAGLAQLKADATSPGAPAISTHDAMSALIWQTALLIRSRRSCLSQDALSSTTGSIFMPSDARRHLNLPSSYVGNAVYQLTAELDLGTLLSPSGLQHAANALRRAIRSVDPVLVGSYMVQLNQKWVDWGFMNAYSTTGVAMGSDWSGGVLYEQDWGEAFGPWLDIGIPVVDRLIV